MLNTKLSILLILPLVISALFLSGCSHKSSQEKISPPVMSRSDSTISIKNFSFSPSIVTIKIGTTITWTNNDSVLHTVTSIDNFDSGNIAQGKTFSYTFDEVGIFEYLCTIHPYMQGKIIVEK